MISYASAARANIAPRCDLFCCSGLAKHTDNHPSFHGRLTNDIHPIFGQKQFPPGTDYGALEPSLRLASRFLALDNVVKYIHTIATGDLYVDVIGEPNSLSMMRIDLDRLNELRNDDKGNISAWPKVSRLPRADRREVSQAMRDEVEQILNVMNQTCSFDFSSGEAGATTYPITGALPQDEELLLWRGCRTLIVLSQKLYDSLRAPETQEQLLMDQFNLAVLIIHELAHAINLTITGARGNEPFYQDSSLAELGFEMENAIFGGLPRFHHGLLQDRQSECCPHVHNRTAGPVLVLWDWPSDYHHLAYKRFGLRIGARGPWKAFGTTKVTRLDMSFVERLFTNAFWVRQRTGELRVPKVGEWYLFFDETVGRARPWLSSREYAQRLGELQVATA